MMMSAEGAAMNEKMWRPARDGKTDLLVVHCTDGFIGARIQKGFPVEATMRALAARTWEEAFAHLDR